MKKITLSLLTLFLVNALATAQQMQMIHFAGKINISKLKKEEIHKRLDAWYRQYARREDSQNNEKSGVFNGTASFDYKSKITAANTLTQGLVLYDFRIAIVENGIEYILTNFRHEAKIKFHTITGVNYFPYKIETVEKPWYDLVWRDIKQQIHQQMPVLLGGIKKATEQAMIATREAKVKDTAQLLGKPTGR